MSLTGYGSDNMDNDNDDGFRLILPGSPPHADPVPSNHVIDLTSESPHVRQQPEFTLRRPPRLPRTHVQGGETMVPSTISRRRQRIGSTEQDNDDSNNRQRWTRRTNAYVPTEEIIDLDSLPDVPRPGILPTLNNSNTNNSMSHTQNSMQLRPVGRIDQTRNGLLGRATFRGPMIRTPFGGGRATRSSSNTGFYAAIQRRGNDLFSQGVDLAQRMGVDELFLNFGGQLPHAMDYTMVNEAINHRLNTQSFLVPPVAPTTEYEPPKEPCQGPFTRTFTETEYLICPGCHHELGALAHKGSLSEQKISSVKTAKERVFVTAKCGHVYCGACAAIYLSIIHKRKKGGRYPVCKAPSCVKAVTRNNAMFEVYM